MGLNKLGRYDLVQVLGKGAMGTVYEGRDPNLERRVAIKTIKVENLSAQEAAEYEVRFRTEARSAARLQHPNIVSVYDSDRDGDVAFLVMEYIEGEDLKHYIDRGEVFTLAQTLSIMGDLLAALDYAHRQAIVHRDIKPANLLMERGGRVKLTDFGVARIQDTADATRTQGTMVGTLKYMAPEQVQGQPVDARADLFAVGIVLYQLLTGRRPFDGGSDFDIIQQIVGQPHPAPSSLNDKLPPAIDAVVARALEKTRELRFQSAREFLEALQTAVNEVQDRTIAPQSGGAGPGKAATWGSASRVSHAGSGGVPLYGSSGLRTSPSHVGTHSTVTQEVELVYWKDIKESEDPEDFHAFLAKFPSGIYADLARRRLKKLSDLWTDASRPGGSDTQLLVRERVPDLAPANPTATAQATPVPQAGPTGASYDPTVRIAPASSPKPAPSLTPEPVPEPTLAPTSPSSGFAPTLPFEALEPVTPVGAQAPTPAPASTPEPAPASPKAAKSTAPRKPGPSPVRWWAAGAAVAVAALSVWAWGARGGDTQPVASKAPEPAPAPAVAPATPPASSEQAAPAVALAPASVNAPAPVATKAAAADGGKPPGLASATNAPQKPAAKPATTQPVRGALAKADKGAAASTPEVKTEAAASTAAAPEAAAGAGSTPKAAQGKDPRTPCEGKWFVAQQLCYSEQCGKSEFKTHPFCNERREQEQRNLSNSKQ